MIRVRALLRLLTSLLAALAFIAPARPAAPPPGEQHPAVQRARLYAQAIVAREWDRCAEMIQSAALERRKRETLASLKSADAGRQAEMLRFLDLPSVEAFEKLSARACYVAERKATFRPLSEPAAALARQLATLRMELLSAATEEEGRFVHVLFRTHRETPDMRIHELMLVSVLQDDADPARWFVVPDSLVPSIDPLAPSTGAAK